MSTAIEAKLLLIRANGLLRTAGEMLDHLEASSEISAEAREFWMRNISSMSDLAQSHIDTIWTTIASMSTTKTTHLH